ncbi:zygote-specific protein 3-like, partial [Penaeus monodon]|uniref:zygote-specific protein 3-like n=1 Tax=Penaeus monodon TaxID=6687 RepID=UPI0018A6FB54
MAASNSSNASLVALVNAGDAGLRAALSADARAMFFNDKSTPLHLAASGGHKAVVDVLVAGGSDPNLRDRCGKATGSTFLSLL